MEVNCVKLENGKEYIIMDIINKNNDKYLVLVEENNEYDIQVRKIVFKDGNEYLSTLDTNEEFDDVLKVFYGNHNGKGE